MKTRSSHMPLISPPTGKHVLPTRKEDLSSLEQAVTGMSKDGCEQRSMQHACPAPHAYTRRCMRTQHLMCSSISADRRVVIPQALGYDVGLTLGPTPGNFQELRSLESIVKNPNRDASLLFDVKLERINKRR